MRASWSSFVSNVVKAQVMHNHTVPVRSNQFVVDMSSNIIINFCKVLSPKILANKNINARVRVKSILTYRHEETRGPI